VIRNYSAVTAACMMTRRELYNEVGGLNEKDLPVAFNDVDYCLRLRERGYLIVYTPYALLYHHESATRGSKQNPNEIFYMMERWRHELMNDPYYNPSLTLTQEDYSIDFSTPEAFLPMYSQEVSNVVVGYADSSTIIGQEFYASEDHLSAIAIKFGTRESKNKGVVRFRLRESRKADEDLRFAEIGVAALKDNEYHLFSFDPVSGSIDRQFYFCVEFVDHKPGAMLGVWGNIVTSDAIGPHFENHRLASGTASFKAYCIKQYRVSDPLTRNYSVASSRDSSLP
jgi:hypothetical protein